MDARKCAQDVLRCAVCKENIVEMMCIFCSVYTCNECVREHSDDYTQHQFVNLKERGNEGQNYSECGIHKNFICEILCRDCDVYLCTKCVLTNAHKTHELLNMEEVFVLKCTEEIVQNDIHELKDKIYPAYESVAKDIEGEMQAVIEQYEKLLKAALKYGQIWHEIINRCTDRFIGKIKHKRKLHLDELKKDLEEIQKSLSQISFDIRNAERKLASKDFFYTPHTMNFEKLHVPQKTFATIPEFQPWKINELNIEESIFKQFGNLSKVNFWKEERNFPIKSTESHKEPKVVSIFNTGLNSSQSLAYFSDEQIWTSGQVSEVKCFNNQGQLKETFRTKTRQQPSDIGVTKEGHLIYCDEWGTVNIVREGIGEEVIKLLDWSPINLCVASNDDLLIMMYSHDFTYTKVVRYSKFKVVQIIQCDPKGKPLYSENVSPKYLRENGNQDVCVSDSDAVVVVNKKGVLRFRYNGISSSSKKSFKPLGICVNSKSHIFIADCYNHSIHIIDHNGKFLRQIQECGLNNPHGLCMDKSENLFVVEQKTGDVKKIIF